MEASTRRAVGNSGRQRISTAVGGPGSADVAWGADVEDEACLDMRRAYGTWAAGAVRIRPVPYNMYEYANTVCRLFCSFFRFSLHLSFRFGIFVRFEFDLKNVYIKIGETYEYGIVRFQFTQCNNKYGIKNMDWIFFLFFCFLVRCQVPQGVRAGTNEAVRVARGPLFGWYTRAPRPLRTV